MSAAEMGSLFEFFVLVVYIIFITRLEVKRPTIEERGD